MSEESSADLLDNSTTEKDDKHIKRWKHFVKRASRNSMFIVNVKGVEMLLLVIEPSLDKHFLMSLKTLNSQFDNGRSGQSMVVGIEQAEHLLTAFFGLNASCILVAPHEIKI